MRKILLLIYLIFSSYDLSAIAFWDRYQAYANYQAQDYASAAKRLEKLLAAEPDNLENLINMGHILYHQKQYVQAANYFEQALQQATKLNVVDPKAQIELLFDLGSAHAQQEKWQEALDAYNQLIKLDPKHERALKNIEIIKKLLEKQKEEEQKKQEQEQQKQDTQKEDQEQPEQNQQDQSGQKQEQSPDSQDDDQEKKNQAGKQPDDKIGSDQKPGDKPKSGQDQQEQANQQANQERLAKLSDQEKEYLEAVEQNDQRANSYLMQMQGAQGQKNEDGNNW